MRTGEAAQRWHMRTFRSVVNCTKAPTPDTDTRGIRLMPTFSYTQDMMKTVDRVPSENMSVGSTWAFPCRVFHGGSTVKIRIDLRNFLLLSLHHPHVLRRITQFEALSKFIHRQRGVRQQVDQSIRSRFV